MSEPVSTSATRHVVVESFPDLQILPLDYLVPHEQHDDQRSGPLIERIREAGIFLNPPVVAPMDDRRYVILDGANRHFALKALGYRYILVQVVDYESDAVHLGTWFHVISDLAAAEFMDELRDVEALTASPTDLLSARASLARREALAYVVLSDHEVYLLETHWGDLAHRTRTLCGIVDTYKRRGTLNRISTDHFSAAREMYPTAVAIVVFPQYLPAEIMVAARDRLFLPPGLTRHMIQGRALRVSYPLSELAENGDTLEEKNRHLKTWIQQRLADKRIRYYAEPSYLFDE
ncbi:MAG TPA: ParB N-terminal domain-containing protein [Aggregatilineaceae bacterium]|nr:ParB N-terminal domain-containing protein [Aggregatilineaceae bacterium]